ncbi:nterminal domain containing protein [Chrysochromulina tobinii]|uniref:Nterminal domain containing protein n=1 Tax=Chrysochromulina tobinii TaxID=1460289 RepID=A0A0M0JQG9_9EUKA|nr:nterminal domain containing protein [Chrysochromulina tobinii]|eukprot:KOO28846.1 nterminal domain containing protein [Chrysochromulina sp. CCMP291]
MACLGKYLNGVDPANITSLEELLEKTDLKSVHELLKQQGIATLEAFMMLTPSAIETMGVTKGLRIRLLRAAEMMRQARPVEFPREEDALMSDTGEADTMPPKHNSTSSLYIDSTISSPDFTRVVFCVSILVHDLIVEGEASHQAKLAAGLTPTNPCALFRPKEIFVTGKRQHSTSCAANAAEPMDTEIPSEDEICQALQQMHALMRMHPGCLVVAMIYIERLRRGTHSDLLVSTWQPTLFAAVILAQKMAQLERDFLQAIDYNVGIKAAVYTEWYFKICTFAERLSAPLRPLGKDVATLLEIRGAAFEEKILAERPQSQSDPTLSDSCKAPPAPRSRIVLS